MFPFSLFSRFASRRPAPAAPKPATVRLGLEVFEDRAVPAALHSSVSDVGATALVATHASGAEHSAPFKLRAEGAIVGVNPDGSFALEWSGTSSLLGRYTATASMVVSADGLQASGAGAYTAANGDEIHFEYTTIFQYPVGTPVTNPATGTAVFAGGTGRFADASAEVDFGGALNADFTFAFSHDDGQELNW